VGKQAISTACPTNRPAPAKTSWAVSSMSSTDGQQTQQIMHVCERGGHREEPKIGTGLRPAVHQVVFLQRMTKENLSAVGSPKCNRPRVFSQSNSKDLGNSSTKYATAARVVTETRGRPQKYTGSAACPVQNTIGLTPCDMTYARATRC
jgi:hypothetical protein